MKPLHSTVILTFILACTFLIYAFGLSGSFYYDDFRPLSKLTMIQDWLTAGIYITTETSGPLGRPLSMVTFALQFQSWPENPEHFFIFNVLLHITNGVLIYLLAAALLKQLAGTNTARTASTLTALCIAALWLWSPLQISTSLIAIQRMAGLSAFFVLAGVLLYVWGLQNAATQLRKARLQQIAGLGLCSLFAAFSKENGILLPVFALVLEKTLFRANTDPDQKLRVGFLWLCFLIVVGYLLSFIIKTGGVYPFRDFTMLERVLTQPYLLMLYLKLAFLPDVFNYNPFHDQIKAFSVSTLPPLGWLALVAVPSLLLLALRVRLKHPVISFAIFWFFAAHLLESTVVGLELYFEHRNYVALFGPCFALGYGLAVSAQRYPKLVISGATAYLALMALVTGFITSIWGTPLKAAEVWFDKEFGSARAAEHLALSYLENNRVMEAYFVLQAQVKACPECLGSRIQYVIVACAVNDPTSVKEHLDAVTAMAPTQRMIGSAPSALASLKRQIEQTNCSLVSFDQVKQLNELLLKYQSVEINASKRFELLLNLHQIAELEKNKTVSLQYLQQAFSIRQDMQLGEVIFNNLLDLQLLDDAKILLEQQMCHKSPINPFLRVQHQQTCQELSERLNTTRQSLP